MMKKLLILAPCLAAGLAMMPAAKAPLVLPQFLADQLKPYSEAEVKDIKLDLRNIRELVFKDVKKDNLLFVSTAGAPLTRKSTTLEHYLEHEPRFAHLAYIDPDARSLFFMINTYIAKSQSYLALTKFHTMVAAKKAAYEKWRAGSNYISNTLLEEAFQSNTGIALGTTLSNAGSVGPMLAKLKETGYRIELILCAADEEVRMQALHQREEEQKIVQVTPEDMKDKLGLFIDRIPTHFQYADKIYLHYSTSIKDNYECAATIDFTAKKIAIRHEEKYKLFARHYDEKRQPKAPAWAVLTKDFK